MRCSLRAAPALTRREVPVPRNSKLGFLIVFFGVLECGVGSVQDSPSGNERDSVSGGTTAAAAAPEHAATLSLEKSARSGESGVWNFAVSGDSRNCGDVVMPAIAAGAKKNDAV